MSNSIFDIRTSKVYPEMLYMDANIPIKIYRGIGTDYEQFLIEAVKHGTLLLYSPIVLAEVKRWVQGDILRTYAKTLNIQARGNKEPWKALEDMQNPKVGQAAVHAWERARQIIMTPNSLEAYMPSTVDLDNSSNKLIQQYGLGVGDAEHLVVMNYNESNSILTDDGGFTGITGINIFSKSGTALKNGTSSSNSIIPFSPFI